MLSSFTTRHRVAEQEQIIQELGISMKQGNTHNHKGAHHKGFMESETTHTHTHTLRKVQ